MRIRDWSSDVCSSDLADSYYPDGKIIPQVYKALTRRERHEELIDFAVGGAVQQVQRAHEIADGKGAININVLWEMGGAQRVLHGVLERTRGLVAGVTCGAGMPYKLSEIAARSEEHTSELQSLMRTSYAVFCL